MPKVHNIGKQHFVQYFRFPAKWGWKIIVRGNTQEIEPPFRMSKPYMIRMPLYRVLVLGKWTGLQPDEETALNNAMQGRLLTNEDFTKEKGWTAAPNQDGKENSLYLDA
jgi:hypothetical protein